MQFMLEHWAACNSPTWCCRVRKRERGVPIARRGREDMRGAMCESSHFVLFPRREKQSKEGTSVSIHQAGHQRKGEQHWAPNTHTKLSLSCRQPTLFKPLTPPSLTLTNEPITFMVATYSELQLKPLIIRVVGVAAPIKEHMEHWGPTRLAL